MSERHSDWMDEHDELVDERNELLDDIQRLEQQLAAARAHEEDVAVELNEQQREIQQLRSELAAARAAAHWCCDHLRFEPHNWALSTWPWLKDKHEKAGGAE